MRKYLPPPHKFRPKTLDSTDTVDFTHFRRTVNRYCGYSIHTDPGMTFKSHKSKVTSSHFSCGDDCKTRNDSPCSIREVTWLVMLWYFIHLIGQI